MSEYYHIDTDVTLSEKIDNDTVVINLTNGCYYNFNPTASYIWELIGCGLRKEDIHNRYTSVFDVPDDESKKDLANIFGFLLDNELIKKSNSALSGPDPTSSDIAYVKPAIEKFDDMQEMLLLDPIHEVTEKGWPYKSDE